MFADRLSPPPSPDGARTPKRRRITSKQFQSRALSGTPMATSTRGAAESFDAGAAHVQRVRNALA
eukprot:11727353-Alexandrium_andersonii.AAC.1